MQYSGVRVSLCDQRRKRENAPMPDRDPFASSQNHIHPLLLLLLSKRSSLQKHMATPTPPPPTPAADILAGLVAYPGLRGAVVATGEGVVVR